MSMKDTESVSHTANDHMLELLENLTVLEERKTELLTKLKQATIMQWIWPDAFDDGQKCRLKYRTKSANRATTSAWFYEYSKGLLDGHKITIAYLERDDGEKYMLTRDQLKRLGKTEDQIHKQYGVQDG